MAAKKRRKKPGLLWRVLFGNNGPTKGELKKLLRLSFSNTFVVEVRDPATGRVRNQRMRVDADGKIQQVKAAPRKAAKKRTGTKPAAKRTTSKTSKPSRTSRTGATPQRRTTAATPASRRAKPVPLADRVLRNPDGTLNGSRKDPVKAQRDQAKQWAQVQRAYQQASRNADAAGRRAEELLGWQKPRRR